MKNPLALNGYTLVAEKSMNINSHRVGIVEKKNHKIVTKTIINI